MLSDHRLNAGGQLQPAVQAGLTGAAAGAGDMFMGAAQANYGWWHSRLRTHCMHAAASAQFIIIAPRMPHAGPVRLSAA